VELPPSAAVLAPLPGLAVRLDVVVAPLATVGEDAPQPAARAETAARAAAHNDHRTLEPAID